MRNCSGEKEGAADLVGGGDQVVRRCLERSCSRSGVLAEFGGEVSALVVCEHFHDGFEVGQSAAAWTLVKID